nr:immunoglobulin heavy chain junction region [Mus musculus]
LLFKTEGLPLVLRC